MAKKKAKKAPKLTITIVPPAPPTVLVRISPTEVLNLDGRPGGPGNTENWSKVTRDLGYEWVIISGTLYLVRPDCTPLEVPNFDTSVLRDGPVDVTLTEGGVPLGAAPAARKAWVVSEIAWEYNDEFYYRPEDSPVFPKRVFLSLGEAQTWAGRQALAQMLHQDNPFDYLSADHESVEVDPNEVLTMDYMAWSDLLREHSIEPPELNADGMFEWDTLEEWWKAGVGTVVWTAKGHERTKGLWSPEQAVVAAQYIAQELFEISEVCVGD